MRLRWRKFIKLRENWAAENYSGPSANISKWRNSYWKVCNGPWSVVRITDDAFIALQTLVRGAQVLRLVRLCSSLSVCLSVSPRGYLRNYTCNLYQTFMHVAYGRGSIFFRQRGKSSIYDCLVLDVDFLFGITSITITPISRLSHFSVLCARLGCRAISSAFERT